MGRNEVFSLCVLAIGKSGSGEVKTGGGSGGFEQSSRRTGCGTKLQKEESTVGTPFSLFQEWGRYRERHFE